jgi:hypothetical protein
LIDPNKITSITLNRQSKAFLNIDKSKNERSSDSDRRQCAVNFEKYIKIRLANKREIKGGKIDMVDFTKTARRILLNNYDNHFEPSTEIDILNSQWRDNGKNLGPLDKMIAMVDNSASMQGDPMNAAIALGIRIAEKSSLGKRVLSFNSEPKWVNLDNPKGVILDNPKGVILDNPKGVILDNPKGVNLDNPKGVNLDNPKEVVLDGPDKTDPTFIEMVSTILKVDWGGSTDFFKALDLILKAIIELKMSTEDAANMTLVILSDMQIDDNQIPGGFGNKQYLTMYEQITEQYYNAGLKLNGIPLVPPHILFWNLRSTNGFPVMTNQYNTSMVSGYSPALLEMFCNKGIEHLSTITPYLILLESLSNKRYDCLETFCLNHA